MSPISGSSPQSPLSSNFTENDASGTKPPDSKSSPFCHYETMQSTVLPRQTAGSESSENISRTDDFISSAKFIRKRFLSKKTDNIFENVKPDGVENLENVLKIKMQSGKRN